MSLAARAAIGAIWAYQSALSPFLGGQCRFAPSCSEYARQAIIDHGALWGAWLGAWRVLRCHPFHPGGDDPPPPARRPAP